MRRYEIYIQVLQAWKSVKKTDAQDVLSITNLNLFDKAACADAVGEEDEEESLTKSHSSPALQELPPQTVIKVKRNISERRTYRRVVVPRLNKEAWKDSFLCFNALLKSITSGNSKMTV